MNDLCLYFSEYSDHNILEHVHKTTYIDAWRSLAEPFDEDDWSTVHDVIYGLSTSVCQQLELFFLIELCLKRMIKQF